MECKLAAVGLWQGPPIWAGAPVRAEFFRPVVPLQAEEIKEYVVRYVRVSELPGKAMPLLATVYESRAEWVLMGGSLTGGMKRGATG